MTTHVILRILSKLLIPLIMVFALYVQFHGDYGPGGGFQAGVIFGAAIILFALIFGLDEAKRAVTPGVLRVLVAAGVLLYGSVGMATIFKGGNFLEYNVLMHDPVHGQHIGILLVELGVGITVTAVMVTVFYHFAGRSRADV